MFDFIKRLLIATRGQRITQAILLLVATGALLWLLRGVPDIFRDADWRADKPRFDEGRIENGRYINDSIGWEIAVPDGWKLGHTRSASENRRAADILNEYTESDSLLEGIKELVSFEKSGMNKLISSTEPANGALEFNIVETLLAIQAMFEEQFARGGMKYMPDYPVREMVGGKIFYTFTAEIEIPARQARHWMTVYAGLVGDRLLSVTMTYADTQAKFELLESWCGSVFNDTAK